MNKRGRTNKYESHVKPRFDDIRKWLENGATEKQVAQNLGIGDKTFIRYKHDHEELRDLIKSGRQNVVLELRGALVKRALGFAYTETKTVTEKFKFPDVMRAFLIENGFTNEEIEEARLIKTETATKQALPDVAALNLALKNYDKDNWSNDPQMLRIRERELKLREKQIEKDDW